MAAAQAVDHSAARHPDRRHHVPGPARPGQAHQAHDDRGRQRGAPNAGPRGAQEHRGHAGADGVLSVPVNLDAPDHRLRDCRREHRVRRPDTQGAGRNHPPGGDARVHVDPDPTRRQCSEPRGWCCQSQGAAPRQPKRLCVDAAAVPAQRPGSAQGPVRHASGDGAEQPHHVLRRRPGARLHSAQVRTAAGVVQGAGGNDSKHHPDQDSNLHRGPTRRVCAGDGPDAAHAAIHPQLFELDPGRRTQPLHRVRVARRRQRSQVLPRG